MIIWDDQTLTVRADPYKSGWERLHEEYIAHGLNGAFTSTNSTGKIEIAYDLASIPSDKYANRQGILLFSSTDEASPFAISVGNIKALYFIRFIATVTVNTITGFTLVFSEMGRGA